MSDSKRPKSIGEYKFEKRIWKGTFGETWQGSADSEDKVAIQLIEDPQLRNLIREASLKPLAHGHECVAPLLYWDEGNYAAVWDYLTGRRLYTFIYELKYIKINIAVYIARKILEVLSYTASKGIIHGGLRPTRILITDDKKVKVLGLGFGHLEQRLLASHYQEDKVSEDIQAILPYFPSEVLEDKIFDDSKSDIYAVGIMLSEMLTGKRVSGQDMVDTLQEHNIKKRLAAIILKAVADFGNRYNHPNEMHRDLTRLLKSGGQPDRIYVPPPVPVSVRHTSMEAVPADSEEYNAYQAEQMSARQTIDAEVVMAEPAYSDEYSDAHIESSNMISQEQAEVEIKKILRKTKRIDADSVVMIANIHNEILDPLEKVPLWSLFLLRHGVACLILLLITLGWAYQTTPANTAEDHLSIFFLPLEVIQNWPGIIQQMVYITMFIIGVAIFFIPFWDLKGEFVLNSFFTPFLATFFSGIVGLGFWQQVDNQGGWYGLDGRAVCIIFVFFGITMGVAIPYIAAFLRHQMEQGMIQRRRRDLRRQERVLAQKKARA